MPPWRPRLFGLEPPFADHQRVRLTGVPLPSSVPVKLSLFSLRRATTRPREKSSRLPSRTLHALTSCSALFEHCADDALYRSSDGTLDNCRRQRRPPSRAVQAPVKAVKRFAAGAPDCSSGADLLTTAELLPCSLALLWSEDTNGPSRISSASGGGGATPLEAQAPIGSMGSGPALRTGDGAV